MSASASPVEPVSQARTRLLLGVLVTAVVVAVVNNSMVTVLLPEIRQDFSASSAAAGWIVTGFSMTFAVGTGFYGRASDVFGIRGVYCAGLILFVAGSLFAALSGGLAMLIAARALQGAGGAAIPSLSSVTVRKMFPEGRRGLAFGLIGTGVGAGQAMGPVLGGIVAQFAGWHSLFLGTTALAVAVLAGAWLTLPGGEVAARAGWRRLDLFGGLLLGCAVALALIGITQAQRTGFGAVSSWGSVLLAIALAVAFAVRIRTAEEPFAPPALFSNARFLTAAGVGFLTQFCYLGTFVLIPQMVSAANGLGAGQVGLVLLPGALAVVTLSAAAGRASDRVGTRPLIIAGLTVLAGSVLALSTVAGHPVYLVGACVLGMGIGLALITSPLVNAASSALSDEHSGIGLGLYQGGFFLGGGSGAAVLGAVLSARGGAESAWNPLHTGGAAAFSDTLLLVSGVLVVALAVALRLPARPPGKQPAADKMGDDEAGE